MIKRPSRLPLVLLLAVLTGCGGAADSASAPPSSEPTTKTSPSAAPTREPEETTASETPAQVAARQLCEGAGIIDMTLTAFIDKGPGPALAEQVRQFTGQLATYRATFTSDANGAAAAEIVSLLERQGPGWEALYGEGETAYQEPKASGNDVDILSTQIEAAWPAAMSALGFATTEAPHAPVVFADGDC